MKNSIKIVVLLIAFFGFKGLSQDFQGKAYYQSKTNIAMNLDGRQISEERKKMIANRMRQALEKTFVLTFNRSESLYVEEERLEQPGQQGSRWMQMMGSFGTGKLYKNVSEESYRDAREFFGKNFLIKDSLQKLEWKMTGDTKKIGKYTCFKAIGTKKIDPLDFRSMRRRGRRNNQETKKEEQASNNTNSVIAEVETPKTTEVIAWYTPEIPVNQGPGLYYGLPGLILEINADRTTLLCSKIVLNPEEKEEIEAPTKGKVVTQDEYNKIITKKMKEMRQNWSGGRRGRTGRSRPRG